MKGRHKTDVDETGDEIAQKVIDKKTEQLELF